MRARRLADRGATAVEYGLMVAAIAAVIVTIVFSLGGVVKANFDRTSMCITSRAASPC
ncbi:MAG: Flp family type IVb pilin [Kineosporiaceae bacterium]|jgi:pilus assembly protein Flp/PilA